MREVEARHRPRHPDRQRAAVVPQRIVSSRGVEEHVARGGARSGLPEVEGDGRAAREPGHQEAAAADVPRLGMHDRQHEGRGHRRVHGVPALLQDAGPGLRGEDVVRHHGEAVEPERRDDAGRARASTRTRAGCRAARGLAGDRRRHGDERERGQEGEERVRAVHAATLPERPPAAKIEAGAAGVPERAREARPSTRLRRPADAVHFDSPPPGGQGSRCPSPLRSPSRRIHDGQHPDLPAARVPGAAPGGASAPPRQPASPSRSARSASAPRPSPAPAGRRSLPTPGWRAA